MGNSTSTASRIPLGVSSLVAELGENEVQYEKSMGSSGFLKAVRARHANGQVLVKTFIKPSQTTPLRHLVRRLQKERETLSDVPNVLTYQQVVETDRAGYLIRQWLSSSLYDRISTRPFLTPIEKKWITYQLLSAMKACRDKQIPHGDLKTENVLVTSSLSVYITDFASCWKPVYLPLDDPADYSLLFDTSGRRTCYVAPERFYPADSEIARQKASLRTGAPPGSAPTTAGNTSITSSSNPYSEILGLGKRDGKVLEEMDVFSLGCVIAELWRDGSPMFTLSQLFKYREGAFDVEPALSEISDALVRDMVRSMISLEPAKRGSFASYQAGAHGLFPPSFGSFLHPYLVDLQRFKPAPASPPKPANSAAQSRDASKASSQASVTHSGSELDHQRSAENPHLDVRRQADVRLERLYEEWSVVVKYLDESTGEVPPTDSLDLDGDAVPSGYGQDAESTLPVQLHIPGLHSPVLRDHIRQVSEDGSALVVLSPILSNLRNALRASSKEHALDLLLHLSARWLTDEAKLDRVLPFMVALFDDPHPRVRAAAVRSSVQLLLLVHTITPANENVCLEYLFPNLRRVSVDAAVAVRATYASCFAPLLGVAMRFLQQTQALRASGTFAGEQDLFDDFDPHGEEATYDVQLHELRNFAQDQVTTLLTDSSPVVKRLLVANIGPLCQSFGMATTNDVLLSHMITYLNDRDWQLRHAFFESVVSVATVAGRRSVEEYIVPLMVQALSDSEDFVVVRVLKGLARIAESSLLSKNQTFDLIAATCGFLCHSNLWIRQGTVDFIVQATARLDATDTWAIVYPSLRPLLLYDLLYMSEIALFEAVKPPLYRNILQAALKWASSANKTAFWKPDPDVKIRASLGLPFGKEGLALMATTNSARILRTQLPRSDEDDGHIDRLRSLGMSPEDEVKLLALREYLWKLSKQPGKGRGMSSEEGSSSTDSPRHISEVQRIDGATPQTIFFSFKKASATSQDPDMDLQLRQGSVQSHTDASFSSQVARRRMTGQRNVSGTSTLGSPIEELRRRMIGTSSHNSPGPLGSPAKAGAVSPIASPRAASSAQARLGLGKAAPAVAESSASATGTMTDAAARLRSLSLTRDADDSPTPAGSRTPTVRPGGAGPGLSDGPLFWSTYEGSDPYVQAHLEAVFVRNFRQRGGELGPRVTMGTSRRRAGRGSAAAGSRGAAAPVSGTRRPEGKLVAYFNEHTDPVTAIAVSADHAFFASGSEDGTVKVWDAARLEKNVTSRSRATYSAHSGKITALIALESSHCFASAATDGSLHVWRIDISSGSLPKYSKPRLVSNFQLSTPGEYITSILQTSSDSPSTKLILATSHSRIVILDLRTMQVLQALRNPAHYGPITCMCADEKRIWLLAGTMSGTVLLWDLRFGLLVKSWRVGSNTPTPTTTKVTGCNLHPSRGRGRWVMISYEQTDANASYSLAGRRAARPARGTEILIETWDIDRGVLVESFETVGPASGSRRERVASDGGTATAAATASSRMMGLASPAEAIEHLVRMRESQEAEAADSDHEAPRGGGTGRDDGVAGALNSHVKAFLVGTEGYISGPSGGTAGDASLERPVLDSWLDAGKLAAQSRGGGGKGDVGVPSGGQSQPAGYIISAGEDCKIRFWDLGKPEKSVCIGLLEERGEFRAVQPERASTGDRAGRQRGGEYDADADADAGDSSAAVVPSLQVVHYSEPHPLLKPQAMRSPLLAQQQTQEAQAFMRAHRDAITTLAVLEVPFRCVVAGDRTGAVKVWE